MAVSSITLTNRFGFGVRPGMVLPASTSALLAGLGKTDPLVNRFKRPTMADRIALQQQMQGARKDQKNNVSGAQERYDAIRNKSRRLVQEDMRALIARATLSDNGFRERLVAFWADHFTVSGKNQRMLMTIGSQIDEVIRPNINRSFASLLKGIVGHPAMLLYLDQVSSIGPNSVIGQKRGLGLNENLAREILELHTMGVDGRYSQDDVRQFAELLTGIRINKTGVIYDSRAAEPGAQTVLGKTYGGSDPDVQDVLDFLDDLAVHPDTARHIAWKLAVHFVSETPSSDLVDAMTTAYRNGDGDLVPVYRAMLEHPDSTGVARQKVKQPLEYMISGMRALNLGETMAKAPVQDLRKAIVTPLQSMGQNLFRPAGPDGWSEAAEDWITPPALAARIEWAAAVAREYGQDTDPRQLLQDVLGDQTSSILKFAVAGAESKWEGVALLLVSPEFNRR